MKSVIFFLLFLQSSGKFISNYEVVMTNGSVLYANSVDVLYEDFLVYTDNNEQRAKPICTDSVRCVLMRTSIVEYNK